MMRSVTVDFESMCPEVGGKKRMYVNVNGVVTYVDITVSGDPNKIAKELEQFLVRLHNLGVIDASE